MPSLTDTIFITNRSNIKKDEFIVDRAGSSVIVRAAAGKDISISSTGIDTGTGDVTISALNRVAFSQQTGAPTTMAQNEEVTVTHLSVADEKILVSVFEEQPGAAGLTNIETDFDVADETKFVQEDAVNGTDFVGGVVKLHGTGSSGNDANTVLLIHSDTTNGSVTFTDSAAGSSPAKAITAFGNIQHSTTLSKFGTSSILLDGTGDYLQTPSHTDLNFASSFTIDTWFMLSNLTPALQSVFSLTATGGHGILVQWQSGAPSKMALFLASTDAEWNIGIATGIKTTWAINTWYHAALTWNGSIYKLFIDGVLDVSITSSVATLAGNPLRLGRHNDSFPQEFSGNIDEFRVSKGIARWTDNFTPPTAAYAAISYPTTQSYYITTAANSQISTTGWADINSVTLTQTTPASTSIKYLVSFDNRLTWKAWNGTAWIASSLANLQVDGMTNTVLGAITLAQWNAVGGFVPGTTATLDFAADLSTTSSTVTPELDLITINYNLASPYETASVGRYGSTADYGAKRLNSTQTTIKKQTIGSKKVFVNIIT